MNENKFDFLAALKKDLEKELEHLKKEKNSELEKAKEEYKSEMRDSRKKELAEVERKNAEKVEHLESKFKQFYYWLFGIAFILLIIIGGMFFYLQNSLGK